MSRDRSKGRISALIVLFAISLIFAICSVGFDESSVARQIRSYPVEISGASVRSADVSPNGRLLALGLHATLNDGAKFEYTAGIAIWDLSSRAVVTRTVFDRTENRNEFWSIAPTFVRYAGGGRNLVSIDRDVVKIFDAVSLKQISQIDLGLGKPATQRESKPLVVDMTTAPEGSQVAVLITYLPTYRSGKLRIYDLESGRMVRDWSFQEDVNGYSLAFSPDGSKIAIAMPQARLGTGLLVFDVTSGGLVLRLQGKREAPASSIFANEDELLTVSAWKSSNLKDGSIKFWDVKNGTAIGQITASPDGIHSDVDISRNGKYLLGYVGSSKANEYFIDTETQRFRIWELPSQKVIATSPNLRQPKAELPKLRLSPDGKTVIAFWPAAGVARLFEITPSSN